MNTAFRMVCTFGGAFIAGVVLLAAPIPQAAAQAAFVGPVPRPTCQPGDRTETGLDGQLTTAERASGASKKPYNCNLEVVGE